MLLWYLWSTLCYLWSFVFASHIWSSPNFHVLPLHCRFTNKCTMQTFLAYLASNITVARVFKCNISIQWQLKNNSWVLIPLPFLSKVYWGQHLQIYFQDHVVEGWVGRTSASFLLFWGPTWPDTLWVILSHTDLPVMPGADFAVCWLVFPFPVGSVCVCRGEGYLIL